jgi:hypothetical protein
LNWKTYVFLYFALTLGAGAAPSKTDIISMLPGLISIVAAIYALNYFGVNIPYLYNVFSWLSAALTVAIIPLLAVTVMVAMLKLIVSYCFESLHPLKKHTFNYNRIFLLRAF